MGLKRIYERKLTSADGNALFVPATETPKCFAIDFPPEGLLKKLIVKQTGGTPKDFRVNVYNDLVVPTEAPGDADPEGGSSEVPAAYPSELAKVLPTQNGTAGQALEVLSDSGYPFRNARGTWSVPERKIYLEIDVTAPADGTTWEVAIAIEPAIPNG